MRYSMASRIAIAVATVGLTITASVGALGYLALSNQLEKRASSNLETKLELLQHLLSKISSSANLHSSEHKMDDVLLGHEDLHLVIFDQKGSKVLATFSPLALSASPLMLEGLATSPLTSGNGIRQWTAPSGLRLLVSIGEARLANSEITRLALLLDRRADALLLSAYLKTVAIGLPVVLLLAVLGGWLTARAGLRPMQRFIAISGTVSSRALNSRIPVEELPPELYELAISFNAMLVRIDEGVTRLNNFSADLAHEMRTPIATLLGRSQVALARDRDVESLRDTLANNIEELERLARLIADMLFLAQSERSRVLPAPELLQLDVELRIVGEFLSMVAEERDLQIVYSGAAQIIGDRILIRRAITNLLSNALRHAHAGSTVKAVIESGNKRPTLAIANEGVGISAKDTDKVFERFYRVDSDRSRQSGGTGLGLAIVRSIMLAHEGEVNVVSDEGAHTTFTLSFPHPQATTLLRK